jgi:hypothetical protein
MGSAETHWIRVRVKNVRKTGAEDAKSRSLGHTGEAQSTDGVWSRHVYSGFLSKLEKGILEPGNYNCLVIDTLHTIARTEDEKDASEVNRLDNLIIDVATRNNLYSGRSEFSPVW